MCRNCVLGQKEGRKRAAIAGGQRESLFVLGGTVCLCVRLFATLGSIEPRGCNFNLKGVVVDRVIQSTHDSWLTQLECGARFHSHFFEVGIAVVLLSGASHPGWPARSHIG